jgi:hypothetical protein
MNIVLIAIVLFSSTTMANICTTPFGYWSFEIAEGVTDFAWAGSQLDDRYFCVFGCLASKSLLQNYKVVLANQTKKAVPRSVTYDKVLLQQLKSAKDDINEMFCQDPVVRNVVTNALAQAPINNATSVANSLLLQLSRPGWATVVAALANGGATLNSVYQDWNFCDYIGFRGNIFYNIKAAMIDRS